MLYGPFNRNWKNYGRIKNIKIIGPHIIFDLNEKTFQVFYKEEFSSIEKNDWVAIDENSQLIRLSPSLRAPLTTELNNEKIKTWNHFFQFIRYVFQEKLFREIQTPTLVPCPGTEPSLDVFNLDLKIGNQIQKVFLPTSPELHLKKALTIGFDKIYEIAKCYRNNEVTDLHQPEFWMLEWYRSFANLFDLQADVVQLIYKLCDEFKQTRPDVQCFTIRQLFKKHLNFDLKPDTSFDELKKLALQNQLRINDSFTIDDLFFILMLEKIEPSLPKEVLVFVEKYPPYQAALARKDHEGWAERFEVYWKGMELANAFDELNDPVEQRKRSVDDLAKRESRNAIQLDESFFQALESGMPPSAGIALGLERLFMALVNIQKIDELRLFPIKTEKRF